MLHLELRHLKAIRAIHEAGGLSRAAEVLGLTQSALSHQIKAIEAQIGMPLFVRRTRPLRLSPVGERLLHLANRVLPEIEAFAGEIERMHLGSSGRLHIAIECHACFDWLLPVLDLFRRAWPAVDIDMRPDLGFDALDALAREEIDLVISADPEPIEGITFSPLFDYEPRLVVAREHPLAERRFARPRDLAGETLITYPVARKRLDVFKSFLDPAGIEPAAVRQVEMTAIILLLVASGRGVSVLPDWVLRELRWRPDLVSLPLGPEGVTRRMHAATRSVDVGKPYMAHFLRLARTEPLRRRPAEGGEMTLEGGGRKR